MQKYLFLAFIAVAAGDSYAADIGFCAAPETITAKLKDEDQHSVASAQMVTPEKKLRGMIFTMSSDHKFGYILEADKPLGERASQICVYNRIADVRLFDARKSGTPDAALLKAPEDAAMKRCDELAKAGTFPRNSCISLNTAIRRSALIGERVIMQGFMVSKAPDGTYKPDGTLTTISGNVNGSVDDDPANPSAGIIGDIKYSSLPDGATILNATLVFVRYSDYGLTLLR